MTNPKQQPIGFFDSGVGGLSVLKKAIELMPNENYIYFGDSKNAPYGDKSTEEVRQLTFEAVEFLLAKGVKAVVIACNTATSAAINELRDRFRHIPIIGIEPALKPAIELQEKGKILIMATAVTLKEKKFKNLMDRYRQHTEIIPLPCPGLPEFIESGDLNSNRLKEYLYNKLEPYRGKDISSIVLGCTHYPFIAHQIRALVGDNVHIIDGSEGTARELKRKLLQKGMLEDSELQGTVSIFNSLDNEEIIELSYKLLQS